MGLLQYATAPFLQALPWAAESHHPRRLALSRGEGAPKGRVWNAGRKLPKEQRYQAYER